MVEATQIRQFTAMVTVGRACGSQAAPRRRAAADGLPGFAGEGYSTRGTGGGRPTLWHLDAPECLIMLTFGPFLGMWMVGGRGRRVGRTSMFRPSGGAEGQPRICSAVAPRSIAEHGHRPHTKAVVAYELGRTADCWPFWCTRYDSHYSCCISHLLNKGRDAAIHGQLSRKDE